MNDDGFVEMKDEYLAPRTVQGHVKWFDPTKGFGFVVTADGGPDILLHANVLRNFGQSSVADSAGIEVVVQQTARGMQAVEVLRIDPPVPTETAPLEDMATGDPDVSIRPKDSDLPMFLADLKTFSCISRCCGGQDWPIFSPERPLVCGRSTESGAAWQPR